MKRTRIGINGMGRIGKNVARAIVERYADRLEIVGVNDIVPAKDIATSLRRDSVYGRFPVEVSALDDKTLRIGESTVHVSGERDASAIPWASWKVDVVLECTGHYLDRAKAQAHLDAGAPLVILSAPPKDDTPIYVVGVNDAEIARETRVISNASCTTNCLAPIVKALDDSFGVVCGLVSTTHAVTAGQRTVDGYGNERARQALNSIIPTTTGAAKAVGRVIRHLEGKLNATSLRVPVTTGSVVEAVLVVDGERTPDEVIVRLREEAQRQNARSPLGTVLTIGDEYQVSADAIGSTWSSMVLDHNVMAIPFGANTLVKVTSFYDNELGYAHRLAELAIIATN